jgi:hypothetical protein
MMALQETLGGKYGSKLRSVIPDVVTELGDAAYDIVEWTLTGIESRAAADAPIGPTGVLAGSQSHESRRFAGGAEGVARSGAAYSAYVNYGTGQRGASSDVPGRTEEIRYSAGWMGVSARPFFSQSVEDGRVEWDRVWRALEGRLPRL